MTRKLSDFVPLSIETPRLVLERFDPKSDAHYACLLGAINNPVAYASMGDLGIKTKADLNHLNEGTRLNAGTLHIDDAANVDVDLDVYNLPRLKVSENRETPLIGGISLVQRTASIPPDLGWCLLPEYHGHGYAAEATTALKTVAQSKWGVAEIMAWPGTGNRASIRTAEKVGLVFGGEANGGRDVVYVLPGMDWSKYSEQKWALHGEAE